MKRIALIVEYNGALFHGWQSQVGVATVQDALEGALAKIADSEVRTHAAGRTDAGVHAYAQTVHFDTTAIRPLSAWVRGVNALLPASIAVVHAQEMTSEFHARFSALSRSYCYVLLNRPQRPGLWQGCVGWHHLPLDIVAMQKAARLLVGEHDFSAFRAAECQAKSPVKTLHQLDIEASGDWVLFKFSANAFLQHMVRNMMGALLAVGQGKQSPQSIAELLAMRTRQIAPPTFAAEGLYFTGAQYPEKFRLKTNLRSQSAHLPLSCAFEV